VHHEPQIASPVCFGFGFTAAMIMGAAVSAMMIGTVSGALRRSRRGKNAEGRPASAEIRFRNLGDAFHPRRPLPMRSDLEISPSCGVIGSFGAGFLSFSPKRILST